MSIKGTVPLVVCLAYIGVDDNSWAGQAAWHLNNVKMIRQ